MCTMKVNISNLRLELNLPLLGQVVELHTA